MRVRVLGAHQLESRDARLTSFLVDGAIAIDAGSISSTLTIAEQEAVEAVLITHHHFDHVRDLLTLGMNTDAKTTDVYSTSEVLDSLSDNLLTGTLYPRFIDDPSDTPSLRFKPVEAGQTTEIQGYQVLALPVPHGPPTVGYQVKNGEGKAVFYTGDTGPGCSSAWPHIQPALLLIEVSYANRESSMAEEHGHMTPRALESVLTRFREVNGYLPKVLAVHVNPRHEDEVRTQVSEVAQRLEADVSVAHEGLEIEL